MNLSSVQDLATHRLPGIADIGNWIRGEWTLRDSDSRKTIVSFDTFIGYGMQKSASVPSNQIEEGGFSSPNKINNPAEFNVSLAKSGSSVVLNKFLEALEMYADSTSLVDIVLPYRTYRNVNIVGLSHSIGEGSAINLLIVDMNLKEIRQSKRQYESVKMSSGRVRNAGDADTVNKGRQQAQKPDGSILSKWLS